jgi:lysozyme
MKKQTSIFILLTISFFSYSQSKKEVKVNSIVKNNDTKSKKVTSNALLFVYGIDISKYQGDEITELSKKRIV